MTSSRSKNIRVVAVLSTVIVSATTMLYLRFTEVSLITFPISERINHELNYQFLTLALFLIVLGISRFLGGPQSLQYLHPGRFDGAVVPVRWAGIVPKEGETWINLGRNFLIIITAVTALVIYFQVFLGNEIAFSIPRVLIPAIGFAIINALVEEGIFRFSIVSVFLSSGVSAQKAAFTSGLLFGAVHYFGTPGGIPGMLLSAFLGWFLAKSIAETRSIGWAWLIHTAQDIVIFSALFATV